MSMSSPSASIPSLSSINLLMTGSSGLDGHARVAFAMALANLACSLCLSFEFLLLSMNLRAILASLVLSFDSVFLAEM